MVYYLFVAPFDLEDPRIVILCKDTDNLNIRPSNLCKADIHQKQQRVVKRERMRSPLLDLSEAIKKRLIKKTIERNSIRVSMYDNQGKKLGTFSSMTEAERKTGVFASSIADVAKKKYLRAGGYFWQFGNAPTLNVSQLIKDQRKKYIDKRGQKLTQYDTSGNKIATYSGVREASEASGAPINSINRVLRGELKSAGGFIWKKGIGQDRIDLIGYTWGKVSMAINNSKPVLQYDLKGKLIQRFNSVKEAAASFNKRPSTLSYVLKGNQKTCGGYIWKYANNVTT
ncbi:MAG TPA: NUMOD1 domain-containing DNA-binding protein [Chitinophagaceae bacterium]|nr:NUMOD1 domain-containing DNA-binding protein [Chitinophagaceae bacterium]